MPKLSRKHDFRWYSEAEGRVHENERKEKEK